jgi:hypothetical protein
MNFGVQNNNSGTKNVNTKIRTFYGELSSMTVGYWNENLSIKINPLLNVTEEGIRQYDFNRKISTAITADKCLALSKVVEEKFLPKMEEVKQTNTLDAAICVCIQVGTKGTAIAIEYKNDEKSKPFLYLTIYTNIGQDGKAPSDGVYSYKFAKVNVATDYDPENGTGSDEYIDAEFLYFYEKLKTMVGTIGASAHSINWDSANKQGNSNSSYSNGNNSQSSNYSAPVSNFDASGFPFNN